MNSKKSKTKNRSKPSKLPKEVDTIIVENVSNTVEVEKCVESNEEKGEVPEQNVEITTSIVENQPGDAPKKPKRSKTKKKQDIWTEPKVCVDNFNKGDSKTSASCDDPKEEIDENKIDEADILPVARKKKNKNKKNMEQPKIDPEPQALQIEAKTVEEKDLKNQLEEDNGLQKEIENTVNSQTEDILQNDSIVPKKKKKKKHRQDSEKSDVSDACISAFQKLLESSEDTNQNNENDELLINNTNITEDTTIPITVHEVEPNQHQNLKENIKDEGSKSKKKNKKGKKHPPELQTCVDEENTTSIAKDEVIISEDIQPEQEELSSKPKAKIIKPVQKKRKIKSEYQEVNLSIPLETYTENKNNDSNINISDVSKIVIDSEVEEKQINKNSDIAATNSTTTCSEGDSTGVDCSLPVKFDAIETSGNLSHNIVILSSLLETVEKIGQENITAENVPQFPEVTESKNETDFDKDSDNVGFVEVKGKHKKKKLQNIASVPEIIESVLENVDMNVTKNEEVLKNEEISKNEEEPKCEKDMEETFYDISQFDFEESSFKAEELEGLCIATPDLIQYPRSTSQQHLDDNNNTIIEEITTPDEVKLGIPIYTPTPIIQGSGESPDGKSLNEPVTVKVKEIDSTSSKNNNEKNDIKSRIFEVNKDMEELRRSIERSLAELTGAEKCDSEVDKEFEELFQKQLRESETSNPPEDKVESLLAEKVILSEPCDNKVLKSDKEYVDTMQLPLDTGNNRDKTEKIEGNKPNQINLIDPPKSAEDVSQKPVAELDTKGAVPICPARSKCKSKSKKKGKKEPLSTSNTTSTTQQTVNTKDSSKTSKSNTEKTEHKSESSKEKGKQQSLATNEDCDVDSKKLKLDLSFEPIDNFEDALTSSVDDVNKTFEIIANEATESLRQNNPQINIIAPIEDTEENTKEEKKPKQNPASQPKNLLGHPNIPATSNKSDYKKEKNKPPNSIQAKVKIKDSVEIEKSNDKQSAESQTDTNKRKLIKESNGPDTYSYLSNTNDDFVYKYNFRKVFLQSSCHVCKKEFVKRWPCKFCSLVFYCSQKHLDDDWPKHQSLCFAVSTIAHLKELKHIYADTENITGHDYRVLRMQMIVSCEKILKRKLVPWEQEALLYPRICAETSCRQWKQRKLKDCERCGQISYCIEHPDHLPSSHQRWCKSYTLYQKLVNYQQTKGRLDPKLPTKILEHYQIPDKMNEVLGIMYEEKIDMDDIHYAALTQLASAPLTAAYGYQIYNSKMNSTCANGILKKSTFTVHAVGTDLQFEADALNKWEIFFLHLRPDIQDLRVVLIGPELNPSKLPLDLLAKIKLCENCRANKRRVLFYFHDKETYCDYYSSDDFITPDIVCAFNPNIHRSGTYNIEDAWPSTINSVLKQKIPFIITSSTIEELERDMKRVKEITKYNFNVITEPKHNPFSSLRPDRNFITDHEIPLLFKNYCYSILCGVF